MRLVHAGLLVVLALGLLAPRASADIVYLNDWTFYVDGATYNPPALPGNFDTSAFDFGPGDPVGFTAGATLGSITALFGPGTHTVIGYFDADIIGPNNPLNNEFVVAGNSGALLAGQIYHADIPDNVAPGVVAGTLPNDITNVVGGQDESMAIGFNFTVDPGSTETLNFVLGPTEPSGFYLLQYDPNGTSVFFSATPAGAGPGVPEPGSLILLWTAAALALGKFRHFR